MGKLDELTLAGYKFVMKLILEPKQQNVEKNPQGLNKSMKYPPIKSLLFYTVKPNDRAALIKSV